jgi:ribonuclease VapC
MLVIDASALLALMLEERGADVMRAAPPGSEISMINLAEVLTRLTKIGHSPDVALEKVRRMPLRIRAFRDAHALEVAKLLPLTAHLGLSFGDRACLTQGIFSAMPIITADERMSRAEVGVEIRMIR